MSAHFVYMKYIFFNVVLEGQNVVYLSLVDRFDKYENSDKVLILHYLRCGDAVKQGLGRC